MKPKLKECGGCNKMTILWKAKRKLPDGTIELGLCKDCANKTSNKPPKLVELRKAINKVSSKEQKRQAAYLVLRKEYMKQYPFCEAQLNGCSSIAVDIHHLFMGADRYKYFLDTGTWRSVCRWCHQKIHDKLSSEELIELGLRLKE